MLFDKRKSQCAPKQLTIVSKDKKNNNRKHIAHNKNASKIYQYKIDGDIIKTNDICKCDYLLENETSATLYFIELKGSDLGHATEQIESTIKHFKDTKHINDIMKNYKINVRIVCHSKTHQLLETKVKKFVQKYKDACEIEHRQIEEDI